MQRYVVAIDGSGDFSDMTSALNAVKPEGQALIYIKNGIYNEKLVIDKPDITLVGEDMEKTVLRYCDGAKMPDETGEPMGTFKTASVKVTSKGKGFQAYNLTFENCAGLGSVVGQAVALYLDCDRAVIDHCRIVAKQDTLLTGPVYSEIEADPYILNRQMFKDCYIEGDVDFIFGGAVAVFEGCTIFALQRPRELSCYLTAACTSSKLRYGYVFVDCKLTGTADEGTVYLGRPWREYANTVFINCELDKCMRREGFAKWNDTDRHKTARYAQYGSSGPGYNEAAVAEWTRILTSDEAAEYSIQKVFEGWIPEIKDYKELV